MIHRRREGEIHRYGINWTFDKTSIAVSLVFPVWIYPYSLFHAWPFDAVMVGERLLMVSLGVRWSCTAKRFFSRCRTWKVPYHAKLVATMEEIEDGVDFSQDLAFQDFLKGEFLG